MFKMKKNYLWFILVAFGVGIIVGSIWVYANREESVKDVNINSFEDCIAAGYPLMESYPRQCWVADGRTFVEVINKKRIYCTEEQRNVDACITLYDPVCGWSDSEKIQCVTYPCASTYSNNCMACSDENVLYWEAGECPSA